MADEARERALRHEAIERLREAIAEPHDGHIHYAVDALAAYLRPAGILGSLTDEQIARAVEDAPEVSGEPAQAEAEGQEPDVWVTFDALGCSDDVCCDEAKAKHRVCTGGTVVRYVPASRLEAAERERDEAKRKLDNLSFNYGEALRERDLRGIEAEYFREEFDAARQQLDQAIADNAKLLGEASAQNAKLRAELEAMRGTALDVVGVAELAKLRADLESAKALLTALNGRNAELNVKLDEAKRDAESAKEVAHSYNNELAQLRDVVEAGKALAESVLFSAGAREDMHQPREAFERALAALAPARAETCSWCGGSQRVPAYGGNEMACQECAAPHRTNSPQNEKP